MINNIRTKQAGDICIIGGGLPGIFSALYLSEIFPESSIHIIESSNKLGGLYNSFEDPLGGIFDKGMHLIYETCIEEVDKILRECMEDDEWIFLNGNYKDIAGIYHNKKLNHKSPYMNLDGISRKNLNECLANLFLTLENQPPSFNDCKTAKEFFNKRFGSSITNLLIEPVMKKLWKKSLINLDASSSRIVLMDRLNLFSEESAKDLMKSNLFRSRIAYPNQMNLNLNYRNKQRGLYPKKFGMSYLISRIEEKLKQKNIVVHKSTKLESIYLKNNLIKKIKYIEKEVIVELKNIRLLVSTISSSQLKKYFNIQNNSKKYDKPLSQKYVFLTLRVPPRMGNLYYFFNFQKRMKTYRVTNYAAYCPDAVRPNKKFNLSKSWPLCVELHYSSENVNEKKILNDAFKELEYCGIIKSAEEILFYRIESAGGFPILTTKNCDLLRKDYEKINSLGVQNLILGGQSPERGIFFLHDVISNIFNLINSYRNFN